MPNDIKIDLWFWHLDETPAQVNRWRSYLDHDEHARMARFMFDKDQTRFTICRSRMRRILGWYTRSLPRDIRFATEGREKPILAENTDRKITFNLTHTDGLACLAVTMQHSVGVDLERIRDIKDDFITYCLNPAELALVKPLNPSDRQTAFFRIWTAKEAYLKAIGTGLWQSLKTFDVNVPLTSRSGAFVPGTLPRVDNDEERQRDWRIFTFKASEEHIGSLAMAVPDGSDLTIRTRWFGDTPTGDWNHQ